MRLAILFSGLISAAAIAQDSSAKPAFDVVSIRPAVRRAMYSGGIEDGSGTSDPERLSAHGIALNDLLLRAFNVRPYQPSGPSWIEERLATISTRRFPLRGGK
jgi:hypothetical protein